MESAYQFGDARRADKFVCLYAVLVELSTKYVPKRPDAYVFAWRPFKHLLAAVFVRPRP